MNSFGQEYNPANSAMTSGIGTHHPFASPYSTHQPPSMFNSSFHLQAPSAFDQDPHQFPALARHQISSSASNHGVHSNSFAPNPFHLSLNSKSNFDHTPLIPNESYNSSGFNSSNSSGGSSSSSPNSSSSSSPDTKFNFLHTPQSSYLNYLSSNSAFSNQTSNLNSIQHSIGHQLQTNPNLNNLHQHSFSSFNQTNKSFGDVLNSQLNSQLTSQLNNQLSNQLSNQLNNNQLNNQFNSSMLPYDEDDLRDDEEDEISMSHYDMKTMMHYNGSCSDPPPGKTRTRDKYRSVYSDLQRNELEAEFLVHKYVTSKRKGELAMKLALSERQIKIWFQNRRAKERRFVRKPDAQDQGIKYDSQDHLTIKYESHIL